MYSKMSDTASGQRAMSRSLECSICLEVYNPPNKLPKTLSCGHTFCSQCLTNILQSSKVQCSKCRQVTTVAQDNVTDLPTNFAIIEMLESTCEKCRAQQWVYRCDHCHQRLCEACKKSHSEDEVKNIKEELIHAKMSVEDMASMYLDQAILEEIISQQKSTVNDVRAFWKKVLKKVELRMEKDMEETTAIYHDIYQNTKDWQGDFQKIVTEASTVFAVCTKKINAKDGSEITVQDQISIKQEYQGVLQKVHKQLSEMPGMTVVQLNPAIDSISDCLVTNTVVSVCNTKQHDRIKLGHHQCIPSLTKSVKVISRSESCIFICIIVTVL